MTNVIEAILNLIHHDNLEMIMRTKSGTRANNAGDSFEEFVADMFANSFDLPAIERLEKLEETFSYRGNQNHPPDIMIKGGDAIEVKKIESVKGGIALNSSHPKDYLYSDDSRINTECKKCECWTKKDIMYIVGTVNKKSISQLSIVYGEDYAATKEIYEKIAKTVKDGILDIPDLEISETNELGRINRVDPLGITYLRIRGMWHIENPLSVFDYIYKPVSDKKFNMFVLINDDKYKRMPEESRKKIEQEAKSNTALKIVDVKIKDPNNPIKLKHAKMISYSK